MADKEHMPREIVEIELEDCRWRFDQGDYNFLIHAFRLCTFNELPLPEWVAQAVEADLHYAKKHGGAKGKGKGGGHRKRLERYKIKAERHRVAQWELDRRKMVGGNRADAFKRAQERLAGTQAKGSADAIEDTSDEMQSALRSRKKAKDHPC